ncbi:MAG: hypothetical protein IT169_14265 [Bryobacterales bacterium]|nr:hypothetical protein [Bryobacterales bacterium]
MRLTRLVALLLTLGLAASLGLARKGEGTPTRPALEPSDDLTVFPHITMGNGWTTKLLFFNVSESPARFRLVFYDNTGNRASIKLRDRLAASEVTGTLQPFASVRLETDNANAAGETQVWAALEEGSGAVAAVQTFEWNGPGGQKTAATIPISDDSTDDTIFVPFDNTDGNVTALVMTNTDNLTTPSPRTVVIEAFDSSGFRFFNTTRVIPSGAKPAFLIATEYPELANRKGVIRLSTQGSDDSAIAVLALQADAHGNLAAVLPFEGFERVM